LSTEKALLTQLEEKKEANDDNEEDNPLLVFLYALRAPETRRQYPRRAKVFFDFLKLEEPLEKQARDFLLKAKQNPQWAPSSLMQFIAFQKERARAGEISYSTISNVYKATKLFVEMNTDSPIVNWKKIARGIPRGRKAANDRALTLEELRKLSDYPDRRIRPTVYVMVSSGIRIGAWDYLKWKNVTPITNSKTDEPVAAKLVVYAGEPDEYYCFITPEAYNSAKQWMEYRGTTRGKDNG
jgi:integrase